MKKKTRDLKKHYRNVEREFKDLNIDLSDDSWYRIWHIHLDWDGLTSKSEMHRKIHIKYYLRMLDKIEVQTRGNRRDFQTWICIDGYEGACDAIYFHTENPEGDFPYWLDNIEWNADTHKILVGLVDLTKYNIGVIVDRRDNAHTYIIQKKGLGLEISNHPTNSN